MSLVASAALGAAAFLLALGLHLRVAMGDGMIGATGEAGFLLSR